MQTSFLVNKFLGFIMQVLTVSEIDEVAGAFNADTFVAGIGIIGGTLLAVASLPEVMVGAGLYAACGGSFLGGAAGGYTIFRALQ